MIKIGLFIRPILLLNSAMLSARLETLWRLGSHGMRTPRKAALRTCRDCDLLIRLIRELALLLRDPLNQQFGFDPVTTAALVRRADRVLALVDASPLQTLPSATSDRDPNRQTAQAREQCDGSSGKQTPNVEPLAAPEAFQGSTVASMGLRVRLVPFEADDSTGPPSEKRQDDASPRLPSEAPPGIGDC